MIRAPRLRPRRARRTLLAAVAGALACLLAAAAVQVAWFVRIALGYSSLVAAGQHFLSGDSLERVRAERLPAALAWVRLEVDEERRTATASLLGLVERTARVRPGLGATRGEAPGLPERLDVELPPLPASEPWPEGSSPDLAPLPPAVDARALERALDDAFVDRESGLPRGTHAVCVVLGGRLVAERYAPPYDRATPLLGWSMSKSVTAALVGRLVQEGRLALDEPAPVPEWSAADDPRHAITVDDLLRMKSGLSFSQNHDRPWGDSLRMLFVSADCGAYAADRPLAHPPGEHWAYSDGTSNVLARLVRATCSEGELAGAEAPYRLLFGPLGMRSAVWCVDASGTFVGSSLLYASARDWARFGWLFAGDGTWRGERLLPEGWIEHVSSPTEGSPFGGYGAHFWRFDEASGRDHLGRPVPPEVRGLFQAVGYQGQVLFVDRKRGIVLVRLGVAPAPPGFDEIELAAAFVRALAPGVD